MKFERLNYLFQRYLSDTCTLPEKEELQLLLSDPALEKEKRELLGALYEAVPADRDISDDTAETMVREILHAESSGAPASNIRFIKTSWFRYAAAVVLILAVSFYVWFDKPGEPINEPSGIAEVANQISGEGKAVLTLANGNSIVLEDAANGAVATQGGTTVIKLDNGQLAYMGALSDEDADPGKTLYNTISTPRGGRYQVVLSDGTKVWLNAASSIRFPTVFAEKERKVNITGEAYLEVEKDAGRGFTVSVNGFSIEVLGTSFNVKSYPADYLSQASLIAGKIQVKNGQGKLLLQPGEYMAVSNKDIEINRLLGPFRIQPGQIESILAWKNGLFVFRNTNIKEIMEEFSRWYDVDIVYKGNLNNETFTGKISRSETLSKALKLLEMTNTLHFKLVGKTIEVSSP